MTHAMITTPVACSSSLRGGQVTLVISIRTSRKNSRVRPTGLTLTVPLGAELGRTDAAGREMAPLSSPDDFAEDLLPLSLTIFAIACFSFLLKEKLAGQEGFEPPTTGFGDRRSTVGATALCPPYLLGLFVKRDNVTPLAVFAQFNTLRIVPLVLHRIVITPLALLASHGHSYAHYFTTS